MNDFQSKEVEKTLAKPDIHRQWTNSYLFGENEKFYEQAFNYIANVLKAPKNSTILDVGCGPCAHSVELVKRGFHVQAVDFSENVLEMAGININRFGLQDKVNLRRENLLSLTFEDETFDFILCWGVLMHVPEVDKAILELSRVLGPGGRLVISEGNMHSLEAILRRVQKRVLGKKEVKIITTPAGVEYWVTTSNGKLMTRHTNIPWLIKGLKNNGLAMKKRVAGQFTELYTAFSSYFIKNLIHGFNKIWFKYVTIPTPAFGNIIIFQKESRP